MTSNNYTYYTVKAHPSHGDILIFTWEQRKCWGWRGRKLCGKLITPPWFLESNPKNDSLASESPESWGSLRLPSPASLLTQNSPTSFSAEHPWPWTPPARDDPPLCRQLFQDLSPSDFSPRGSAVKNPPVNAGDTRDTGSIPGLGRFPWRRAWQTTPVFLPRESHGRRSLAGYRPWSCKRVRRDLATKQQLQGPASFRVLTLEPCAVLLLLQTVEAFWGGLWLPAPTGQLCHLAH